MLTSCCDAFAHGANDVANSIGPFSAIWHVYRKQELAKKSDVPIWILVIGGGGIVIGLATYGYNIIRAIGVKLTKITPSRGFSIEMGSALVVVTGSYLGLPLSTTHCQVRTLLLTLLCVYACMCIVAKTTVKGCCFICMNNGPHAYSNMCQKVCYVHGCISNACRAGKKR